MGQSKTKQLFKGISVQTGVTICLGVMEIVVFSIMSRLLTKTDFGYFAALTGITTIFTSVTDAGIGSAVIQKKNVSARYESTAFTLCLLISLIMASIFFLSSKTLAIAVADNSLIQPLRLMTLSLLLCSINSYGAGQFYKKMSFTKLGIFQVSSYLVSSLIGVILAYKGYGVYALVIMLVSNTVIYSILLYTSSIKIPKLHMYKKESKEIISFGGWLTLGVILNNITGQLDKLLLPKWMSVQTLGSYNRPAGFISSITNKINRIYDTVLFPTLSTIQDDIEKVIETYYRAFELLNTIAIILSCIFFFNAELIISIFFGNEWLDLVPVMRIISISVIFLMNNTLADCFFRSLNHLKSNFFIRLAGVFIMFIAIFFGSRFGIIGVSVASLLANFMISLSKIIVLSTILDCSRFKLLTVYCSVVKSVIPICIIGAIYIFFVPKGLLINVLFAVVFSLLVCFELIFLPELVGKEYFRVIYPYIENTKRKVLK